MIVKSVILPTRVRKVPKSFSWIDHRLVRDGHIEQLSHPAAALYLFLVCVGDHQGLSYYGDKSVTIFLWCSLTIPLRSKKLSHSSPVEKVQAMLAAIVF